MDLFTYLMAKKGHNSSVHGDLASYLMGKGQAGTYVTKSGVTVTVNNSLKGKLKNWKFKGMTSQDGEPTPDNPIPVKVVTGDNNLTISNQDRTQSQTYPISLGDIELCKIGDYQDYIYHSNGNWYLQKNIGKLVFDGSENWELYLKTLYLKNLETGTPNSICSHFINKGADWISSDENNRGKYTMTNQINQFKCMPLVDMTVQEFKDWLSTHNTTVYYVLATANDVQITDETLTTQLNDIYNHSKSYDGVTNITTTYEDGNEQMILEFDIKTSN